jgi:hypothetical protein
VLVQKAHSAMDDFDDACRRNGLEHEHVAANWDAAFSALNPKSERIRIGIVICNQEGNVKAAQSSVRRGRLDPTTAETVAVVQILRFCKEIGFTKIYFL